MDLLTQLQNLQGAPSVQMQEVPPEFTIEHEGDPSNKNDGGPEDDIREKGTGRTTKGDGKRRAHPAEFYDEETNE